MGSGPGSWMLQMYGEFLKLLFLLGNITEVKAIPWIFSIWFQSGVNGICFG